MVGGAKYTEELKWFHQLQDEYLLLVNNDIKDVAGLVKYRSEQQEKMQRIDDRRREIYKENFSRKRRIKTDEQYREYQVWHVGVQEELTLKIEDVETLLEDVSDVAYDKAVEVVTDKVREQTQLEDLEVIEKYRKSVVSPNAKNSPEVVKIANTLLGRAREKLQQSAEKILKKVQAVLLKPEVKQAGKEQIKKKARESIKEKLAKGKLDADRKNRERWEREGRIAPTKKQDMEL